MKAHAIRRWVAGAIALVSISAGLVVLSAPAGAIDNPVRLATYFSDQRDDYFTTTDPAWNNCTSCAHAPDYVFKGWEGYIADPTRTRPAGTVPLYHWYSNARGDNFLTTNPAWSGTVGTVRNGYRLSRIEGYVATASTPGTVPLQSWWSPSGLDNATSAGAAWRQQPASALQSPDYTRFRTEGYIAVPNLIVSSVVSSNAVRVADGTWHVPVAVTLRNTGAAPADPRHRVAVETNEQGLSIRRLWYVSGAGAEMGGDWTVWIAAPIAVNGTLIFNATVGFDAQPPAAGIDVTIVADSLWGYPTQPPNSSGLLLESDERDNGRSFTTR
jgi:hypothetical protein